MTFPKFQLAGLCALFVFAATLSPAAHSAAPPKQDAKPEVGAVKKALREGGWKRKKLAITKVLDAFKPGVYPVIGGWSKPYTGQQVKAMKAAAPDWEGAFPKTELHPFVALVTGPNKKGQVTLIAKHELVTDRKVTGALKWTADAVSDFDGEGDRELSVTFSYDSLVPGATYGEAFLRENHFLDFRDGQDIKRQARIALEQRLGDEDTGQTTTRKIRFVPRKGDNFKDIVVTVENASGGTSTERLVYDPGADVWK